MAAIMSIFAVGLVLLGLLSIALRYGSTRISTIPAGGCVFPEAQPPTGELTASIAAALYSKHRHCFDCPIQRLTGDLLDAGEVATNRHLPR